LSSGRAGGGGVGVFAQATAGDSKTSTAGTKANNLRIRMGTRTNTSPPQTGTTVNNIIAPCAGIPRPEN
jgi:hypothetical protein